MKQNTLFYPPQGSWCWITLEGKDASDFLHRLTTADVRNLELGQGAGGCLLTPQGRIRALFTIWKYGPAEFALEFGSGEVGRWKKSLLEAIDQFTFAEKFALAEVTALECAWIFPAEGTSFEGLTAGKTAAIAEEIRLCHHGEQDYGRPWISAWGRPERLKQWLDRTQPGSEIASHEALDAWRISALRPRLDVEITDATNPLEVGLIDTIAQNKGCYPGQEVIEKIISLGAPAQRLARIEGLSPADPAPVPGDEIVNFAEPPAKLGQITSVTRSDSGFVALGMIRKIHAKEGLDVSFAGKPTSRARIARISPYA